jgi:hypothetical protein
VKKPNLMRSEILRLFFFFFFFASSDMKVVSG